MIKKIIPSLMKTLLRYRLLKILFACKKKKFESRWNEGVSCFRLSVCILVQEIPTGTEHN